MDELPDGLVWSQMSLFEGGYPAVMVEFTCHLVGRSDTLEVNVVVSEPASRAWIAAQVPTALIDLRDEHAAGQYFADFLEGIREHLTPF